MKTVWKYELLPDDYMKIEMPEGAEIILVDQQFDTACIWALVDPSAKKVVRTFRLAGTGHPIEEPVLFHHGSFQLHGGALIFHLFEI